MIEHIFDYWKQVHDTPRSKLDKDRAIYLDGLDGGGTKATCQSGGAA